MKYLRHLLLILMVCLLVGCAGSEQQTKKNETKKDAKMPKIDLILDWVPNTNHTGLFVAKDKGFDKEQGFILDVKRPPEGSQVELVANGHANFAISFQDLIAPAFDKNVNVKAIAAIIEHNTSGIISRKDANINTPKDMEGKNYGTWDDPIEKGIIKKTMENNSGDFSKLNLVPNTGDNSVLSLNNKLFQCSDVYYAWDVLMSKHMNIPTNFFYIKDFAKELDYYSPIIIANSDYISKNPDMVKKVLTAIKKGYQYSIKNPDEAADILIKNASELADKKDFVHKSQQWISKQYTSNPEKWGYIDKTRWDNFYKFLYENKLIKNNITNKELFTNEFLG